SRSLALLSLPVMRSGKFDDRGRPSLRNNDLKVARLPDASATRQMLTNTSDAKIMALVLPRPKNSVSERDCGRSTQLRQDARNWLSRGRGLRQAQQATP